MRSLVLLLSTLLVLHSAQAETVDPVSITNVYSYATAGKQKHGAVFFTVEHQTPGDKLIKVETEVSEIAELHTHIMEGEIMKMRKVDAINIPESGKLELKPRADHVMLMGLKKPLVEGETFPLTLTFEKSGTRTIEVPVVKAGMTPTPTTAASQEDHGAHGDHHASEQPAQDGNDDHHSHH